LPKKIKSLTVAALQTGVYRDDEKRALSEGVSFVRSASKSARLVCFPEHWLVDKVLRPDDMIYRIFSDLASELDVYINLGGVYEKSDKGVTYFISPTISPRGEIISKQEKIHLFRRETKLATGGDSFRTFLVDGILVGVMVCHDVVFPESARTLVLRGAELLLNPSLITSQGVKPWRIYLMARVLENRVPLVAANPYVRGSIPGESTVLGLKYDGEQGIMQVEELARGSQGKRIVVSKVAFGDEIAALRKERLSERKPRAYA
jgi:omega-amidase